jgi:CelD/BcsL family acetyltransferase involved in cellulose biosynthesis
MNATLPLFFGLPKTVPTPVGGGAQPIEFKILSDTTPVPTLARSAQSSRLRLEVLRGRDGLKRLEPHWDKLLDQNAVRTPFMRWDWAETWWNQFEADYRAIFGVAWAADGSLVALVPLVIGPGQTLARRRLRLLAFFAGLGEVVAEGLDFMVQPGHEAILERLTDHVFEAIRDEWDMAHFGYADESSPFYQPLAKALQKHGVDVESHNRQESPVIRLAGLGWEDYLMERTANFRKKIRRHSLAARKVHQMVIREPKTAEEVPVYMEHLHRLHRSRWTEGKSLFLRPRARAFHHELARRWMAQQRVVLLVMEFSGEPVAANYAFVEGDRMWDYQGGWDVRHIELSPAKLINAHNVQRAMARGLQEIDMLPGDIEYKSKWTQVFRQVVDLEAINPNSVRARVFQSVRCVKRALSTILPGERVQS